MRKGLVVAVGVLTALALVQCGAPSSELAISLDDLQDRIEGGWAGQMVGVAYGYPTEFVYNQRIIPEDQMPEWTPDMVANALDQDDLYVEMTFATVLDDKGLDATTQDFGDLLRNAQYRLWHANLGARRRPEARSSRRVERDAATQCPCQRHRLPDRGRLRGTDDPGHAGCRERTCASEQGES